VPSCLRAFELSQEGVWEDFPYFRLEFGIWSLFGIWDLEFGISGLRPAIWDLEFPLTGVSGLLFFQNRFKEVFGRDIPIKGNLFDENLSGHLPVRVVVAAQRGVNSLNGMPIPEFRFLL